MPARSGRPEKLDGEQRSEIAAILWAGGTRALAARYVGCTVRTINATLKRDAEFAERVHRSEESSEIDFLANIHEAGKEKRYWRASAWALERIDPQRFVIRRPDAITIDQIRRMVGQFCDIVNTEVPESFRSRVLARLSAIFGELGIESKGRTLSHDA